MNSGINRIFRDQRENPKHDGLKRVSIKQLSCGDYIVERDGLAIMIIEHKSPADLYHLQLHDHDRRRRQETNAIDYGSRPECRCFLVIDEEGAHLLRWSKKSAEKAVNIAQLKGEASSVNFKYETTHGIGRFVGQFAEAGWAIVLKPAGIEWETGYPLIEALLKSTSTGTANPLQDVLDKGLEAGQEYLQTWQTQDERLIVPCVKQLLTSAGIDRLRKLFPDSIRPSIRVCAGLLKLIYRHFAIILPDASDEELGDHLKAWVERTGIPRLRRELAENLPELQDCREELSRQNGCWTGLVDRDLAALGLCVRPGSCPYGCRNGGESQPRMAVERSNLRYLPGVGDSLPTVLDLVEFAKTTPNERRELPGWLEVTFRANLFMRFVDVTGYTTLRSRIDIAQDHGLIGSPTLLGEAKPKNTPYRLWVPRVLVQYPFDWQHTWFMGLYSALLNGDAGNFRPRTQLKRLERNFKKSGRQKASAGGTAAGSSKVWKRKKKGRPIARIIPFLATLIAVESGGNWKDAHLHVDAWVAAAKKTLNDLYDHSKAPHVRNEAWNRAKKLFLVIVEQAETFTCRLSDGHVSAARGTLAHTDEAVPDYSTLQPPPPLRPDSGDGGTA